MKIAGIYKITNRITGDFYVGSSKDIKQRWYSHKSPSMWKQQPNSKLYQDMAQYGKDKFKFEVIEETTDLRLREQYWVEQLSPSYNNIRAQGLDIKRHKETTRRCSKEWRKSHQNENLAKIKAYYSRLCSYNGETLTLGALSTRFRRQGIPHPTLEAMNYLIERSINNELI